MIDRQGHLVGTIGLREILSKTGDIRVRMSPAAAVLERTPAVTLLPTLTDGRTHAVIVVDQDQTVAGLITQTDLLSAIAKLVPTAA